MKSLKVYKGILLSFLVLTVSVSFAQLKDGFDIKKAYQDAKTKGIAKSDIEGYVQTLHHEYLSHKSNSNHTHSKTSANNDVLDLGTVYVNSNNSKVYIPNSPQNTYCPNAGFEQFNFTNWAGGYGQVATGGAGAAFPTYNQTAGTIVNPGGNNTSLVNTQNYHTIMTTPATNSLYPNCVGYDSIACRIIGTQTVSEIPVVNPSGGPASVRMNGAISNYRACKLSYNLSLNPNNKNFSISYALVLNNGGHTANDQPYFSVKVFDQNNNLVPGCSTYTVTCDANLTNTASTLYDPTWQDSDIGFDVMYRKWSSYAFDFSNYPAITSVRVEFYVGGCGQGGHYGYAYVDAQCSQGGAVASFCAGSNSAVLSAPNGYETYQWVGPSGTIPAGSGGTSPTVTLSPVTAGQIYTCNVTSDNGCSSSFQTTVSITSVSITGMSSTPSCPNGNSGSAGVTATGSNLGYSYQWFNSSGSNVGSNQTATGLSPGLYSVTVSSPGCGFSTSTVSVGNAPPTFYSQTAPFCGNTAWINGGAGTTHKWYSSTGTIIASATTPTLTVTNPVDGGIYFLAFTTPSGCRDSIKYTLDQVPGGSIYVSDVKSICPGNTNATAVVNLQTTASPAAYSYSVSGPSGYNSVLTNTSSLTYSLSNMPIGTYTANVFDGMCLYNTTFTVAPYLFSYTLTPQTPTICTGNPTTLTVNFGNTTPSACGLSSSGGCTSPNLIQVGNGTATNSSTSYPAIYSNWYKNARHQLLFRASELLAAGIQPGKISSIAFNVTTINGTTSYPNFTIKMKCTAVQDLNSTTFDNTGLTQVYFAATANIATGWNTYNFPTAYEWDGTSNILVDVCSGLTSSYTNNSSSPYTITSFVSVRYMNDDLDVACMTVDPATTSSNRPNVRFANCGGSNPALFSYTWTPTTNLNPTNTYTTIANPAANTVYTVEVEPIGQTNCKQTQSSTVTVVSPATPTITAVSAMCNNSASFTLGVTPTGGTWNVTAATSASGVFTPSLATIGNNTVTYVYGGAGCLQTTTMTIPIEQFVPSTFSNTLSPLCTSSSTVNLPTALGTSTLGVGTWNGNGVTGSSFNPAIAGAGTHTITYNTNSASGLCPSTSSATVSVSAVIQPTITPVSVLCNNAANLNLSATPTGGTWSVTAATSSVGVFTPSLATVGNNVVTYVYGNPSCLQTSTATIAVEQFVPSTISGTIVPQCITNPVTNLSTSLSTSTLGIGTWSGNGVTGSSFDPSVAGVGNHVITYSTNSVPSGVCPSTSTIQISVSSVTQPTATPAGPYCDNYSAQTMTVTPLGGTWSAITTGAGINAGGIFNPSTSVIGNNALLYTLTNGPCVKTETITVNVVRFIPATLSTVLGPYCVYEPTVALQPIAVNTGGTWSGNGVTSGIFNPNTAGIGSHVVTYSTNPAPTGLCPDVATTTIIVNPKPEANITSDKVDGCNPTGIQFQTTSVAGGNVVWDFGDGEIGGGLSSSHTYTNPGTYTASLTYTDAATGCMDTTIASFDVEIYEVPDAQFEATPDITTVIDAEIHFNNTTVDPNNDYTYLWNISDLATSNETSPMYLYTNSGTYTITMVATSIHNCIDTAVRVITINPDVVLYVPNAFTPGADGLNDQFAIFLPPTGVDYATFNLTIYNRWGSVIYKTNDVNKFWNGAINNSGEIVQEGVYVWKISFLDTNKKYYEKLGHVTVIKK